LTSSSVEAGSFQITSRNRPFSCTGCLHSPEWAGSFFAIDSWPADYDVGLVCLGLLAMSATHFHAILGASRKSLGTGPQGGSRGLATTVPPPAGPDRSWRFSV